MIGGVGGWFFLNPIKWIVDLFLLLSNFFLGFDDTFNLKTENQ